MVLTPHTLHANRSGDVAALRTVLENAPAYSCLVKGRPPLPTVAEDVFTDLPPGLSASDKVVTGFMCNEQMVGFVDVCNGYPEVHTAYIGMLIFAENYQGRGFGREALTYIHTLARSWDCHTLRVAVIENNTRALTFWEKEGFGQLYRKTIKGYNGDAIVLESHL
jgi:ribosomal protein S18 acetylase RimI-like enzyme